MPTTKMEPLDKNRVKFTVTISADESKPYLEEAAQHISEETNIPGFRAGKASYEIVKQRVGEMKIMEHALEDMVRSTFVAAVLEAEIETVGSPNIDVEKMAPGNDIVYTAEVTRMPIITKLADYASLSIKAKPVVVEEKDMNLALRDLSRMQTREVRAKEGTEITTKEKVVVSMDMKKDGVSVEGGTSPSHAIYLAEEYYIPGLKEQLVSMKEGDEKTFTLTFPKDHVQKMLAGAPIEFVVKIKEIHNLEVPSHDDAFAQSLGQKDFATMKSLIEANLKKEKEEAETMRLEREMLEAVADTSHFEDIPDLLVNEEINKMAQELQHHIEEQGLEFDAYLKNIGKTLADLKLDFTPQALRRIKVALILRTIAKQEKIVADPAIIDKRLDELAAKHDDAEIKKNIYSPVYREYTESIERNQLVIEHLRKVMVK